ncbi:hypothetical protein ACFV6E_13940 [Streptomyces sp. NPDC059785]|uniref:hypothetical protein n=1 Tax=Streptomyces sp. NPDC059785 TaxID=3346945 RepID=UPI003658E95D
MSGPDGDASPGRRIGELAALVSAATAVVGLLLALFGVPFTGGSAAGRSVAGNAGAGSPAPSTPASALTSASASASEPASSSSLPEAVSGGHGASTPAASSPAPRKAVPKGWHRVDEPGLTAAFAVPDGWVRRPAGDIQSTWRSPDDTFDMSVKRDTTYGSTAQKAAAGQLAWYRRSAESSMADLAVVTHRTRQNDRDALWLEIGYHWTGQSEARTRLEVFVAGEEGQVYQLLVDAAARGKTPARQRELFATARAHLLIDVERSR